ncbi:MAG TPA: nuclear transport factor 2 family protein [Egibacteraceae bacterium]
MSPDLAGLEAANERFYQALERADLDAMEAVWAHDAGVVCVHPGSELISGWPAVRRSWAAVFASGQYLQLIITDVRARVLADAGVVTCAENALAGLPGGGLAGGRSLSTNVFVWDGGAWRMVAHHASPVLRRGR